MGDNAKKIFFDMFAAFYQSANAAFVITVLFTFFYLFARKQGWRQAFWKWRRAFRSEHIFRRIFMLLFLPFMLLLLWSFHEKILGEKVRFGKALQQSVKITFFLALLIELLQLFLWLGTFQLADLFYDTLGGGIGGIWYWICDRVKRRR